VNAETATNTIYVAPGSAVGPGPEADAIATEILTAFTSTLESPTGYHFWQCRLYDMADAKPREPIAQANIDMPAAGTPGPGEVALCLSFYAQRNLPRQRGRIYTGPFRGASTSGPRPGTVLNDAMALGAALMGLSSGTGDWQVFSPTTNTYRDVTNYWVDDAWDTVRSRGWPASGRQVGS
jgi:hypothetical protein